MLMFFCYNIALWAQPGCFNASLARVTTPYRPCQQMKTQFALDDKLLIGCKTNRSAEACRLLVEAGFTQVFNVESQLFMRTRAPEVWE